MIGEASAKWKAQAAGPLDSRRIGCVVEKHPSAFQVVFNQFQKFEGEQVRRIRPEIPRCVRDDRIKAPIRMKPQPASPVVGDDTDLRVRQH